MAAQSSLNDQAAVRERMENSASKNLPSRSTAEAHRDARYGLLFDYFRNYTKFPLSPADEGLIGDAFKLRTVRRRQFLVQEGDVCKYIWFVLCGALRIYAVNERGQEAVVAFALEGNWMSDWESVVTQTPAKYYIDAVDHSEILQVSPAELHVLEAKIPAIAEFLRLEQRAVASTTQKRIHTAISMNAEERYQDLLEHHPEYFQRFSQNMIASYLGVKPETLSRLRKR